MFQYNNIVTVKTRIFVLWSNNDYPLALININMLAFVDFYCSLYYISLEINIDEIIGEKSKNTLWSSLLPIMLTTVVSLVKCEHMSLLHHYKNHFCSYKRHIKFYSLSKKIIFFNNYFCWNKNECLQIYPYSIITFNRFHSFIVRRFYHTIKDISKILS